MRSGIAKNDKTPFHECGGGGIGTLGVAEFGEDVEPSAFDEAFGKRLRPNGEGIHLNRFKLLLDVFNISGIGKRFVITKSNVGFAGASYRDAVYDERA